MHAERAARGARGRVPGDGAGVRCRHGAVQGSCRCGAAGGGGVAAGRGVGAGHAAQPAGFLGALWGGLCGAGGERQGRLGRAAPL